jgi:hypothetical protein
MRHHFRIHAGLAGHDSFVELDGKRLDGVTEVSFSIRAGKLTETSLKILGYADITGDFRETEILRVDRQEDHFLRARVKRAFKQQFPKADDVEIKCFTDLVMRGIDGDGESEAA